MKRLRLCAFLLSFALVAASAVAQLRGEGRLSGKVVDEQGQPVQDAEIKATLNGQSLQAKSNKKGEWTITNVGGGEWIIDISKPGFDPVSGKIRVDEANMEPSATVKLVKHVEKVDPTAEINAQAEKAGALIQQQKFAEARKIFEDLLVKYPEVHQLHAFIGQTYAGENNLPKAIEHMKIANEKDPTNVEVTMFLGDLLMESGDKAAGTALLRSVDITKIKNPLPLVNVAIGLINESKTDEAIDLLTKLVQQFPTQPEPYYYRGRAYIGAKKMPEAKADLEKFVSIAPPGARELPDAKEKLAALKDVK
jgi:predicted Zn-dependent protease